MDNQQDKYIQSDPISVNGLLTDFEQQHQTLTRPPDQIGLFTIRTGNEWIRQAQTRPIPKMLFDVFWFEGEIYPGCPDCWRD